MTDRGRNLLILLIVAGLVTGSAIAIAVKPTRLGLDLKGGVELVYQAKATAQSKVDTESLERAINIMRSRVDKIGVSDPEIQRSGKDEIDVALPDVHNVAKAEKIVGTTAQLNFYDWETNVIGASGKTEPSNGAVTGDSTNGGAGGSTAGLTEYQAVQRAAKRAPILRGSDTTWTPGCTPEQKEGCIYGSWYLLDTAHETVVSGPEETEAALYSDLKHEGTGVTCKTGETGCVKKGAKLKPVRVNPGTVARPGPPDRRLGRQSHQHQPQQLLRAQRRPGAERRRTSPTPSRASTKAPGAAASPTSPSASPTKARRSSNGSPRKSPTAARKPSCPG